MFVTVIYCAVVMVISKFRSSRPEVWCKDIWPENLESFQENILGEAQYLLNFRMNAWNSTNLVVQFNYRLSMLLGKNKLWGQANFQC